jgi:hypothetical protein
MPETRENPSAAGSEMTQRFVEFVLFQTQNASMFLGMMPNPHTGKTEVNLEVARMLIDQLEMIEHKTRGNLNADESHILGNALTNLRMAFVEASSAGPRPTPASTPTDVVTPPSSASANQEAGSADSSRADADESVSRKKFSKSYGA